MLENRVIFFMFIFPYITYFEQLTNKTTNGKRVKGTLTLTLILTRKLEVIK